MAAVVNTTVHPHLHAVHVRKGDAAEDQAGRLIVTGSLLDHCSNCGQGTGYLIYPLPVRKALDAVPHKVRTLRSPL